jgi:RNA polymerase sigma-70 factor (ECF subfamily)
MTESFAETVELIRSARGGDSEAIGAMVARYRKPLLERIRVMMGAQARGAADSNDFLQDLFIEVVRDFENLERCDERSFLRWATCIARNNIRDSLRRRRERAIGDFASSIDWRPADGAEGRTPPPDAAAHQEQVDRLVDALAEVPEDYRLVIELRHFESLSFAEVGRRMARSENAVQILHHRALIRLGGLLRHDD